MASSKALLILGIVLVFVLAVSCDEALHSSQEDAKEANPDRYGDGGYGGRGGGYGGGGYGGRRGGGGGYGGGHGGGYGGGHGGGYGGGHGGGHGGHGGRRGGHPPEETEEVKN